MLKISFGGWVVCRLATDPDPFDHPRGVDSSFLQFAYDGEPDLDRVISFQNPPFVRTHGFPVGVQVIRVEDDTIERPHHPLVGASVNLVGSPVFEGRNGAIAPAQSEPIVPFNLELSKNGASVTRSTVPSDPADPFSEFFPAGQGDVPAATIQQATGVADLRTVWDGRLSQLENDLENATDGERAGLEQRLFNMRNMIDRGLTRMFTFALNWEYKLTSTIVGKPEADWAEAIFDKDSPLEAPWQANFWIGGWDPEVQQFYCAGELGIPTQSNQMV